MADRSTPEPEPEGADDRSLRSAKRVSKGRRVTTNPPPGSDPTPAPEPPPHPKGENDERMRGDKPPHY